MSVTQQADRLHNLDVLRGIAVLLVLWRHVPTKADLSLGGLEAVVDALYRVGWCGVDLFFVLSGFLISGLLFKEFNRDGRLNLPRFWIRRGFKIWPSYFCAYGLMVVLNGAQALWRGEEDRLRTIRDGLLPNLLLVQNYFPFELRWPNSWSLAVEEHFYLTLPLLLVGLAAWGRRRGEEGPAQWFRRLPVIGMGLCAGILAFRVWRAGHAEWKYLYYPTHTRADALIFGVLLGYLQHYRPEWFRRLARLWPALLLAAALALLVPYRYPLTGHLVPCTVGFTVLYLGFGGLVLLAGAYPGVGKDGPVGLGLLTRGLARLGVYSYGVYLCHSVVLTLPGVTAFRRKLAALVASDPFASAWLDRALFFALSIGGAVVLARLVEQPLLRWRERLFATPARPASVPSLRPACGNASSQAEVRPMVSANW